MSAILLISKFYIKNIKNTDIIKISVIQIHSVVAAIKNIEP